jgi:hypothetical protein
MPVITASAAVLLSPARPRIVPLSNDVVAEEFFRHARPDDLIPICSFRPGRLPAMRGQPYIHSYFPLRAEDNYEAEQIISDTAALGHKATYWMVVTLRPEACERQPVWEGREQLFSYEQVQVSQILGLFFDLDVGRSLEDSKNKFEQMTADEALDGALDLVDANVIPMPTLTAPSGRGQYLIYLFKEPLDATPDNRARWRLVVDGILDRIGHLAPDIGACHTLNRLFKAPGSGGTVIYSMVDDGSHTLRRYDLDEIDAFLLNHAQEADTVVEPPIERHSYEPLVQKIAKRRNTGGRSWLQNARSMIVRRNELQRINEYRKGRWPGMRHRLLMYFVTAERFIGRAHFGGGKRAKPNVDAIALQRALRFNAKLATPLPEDEVEQMFDTMPKKPQRNATIATELGVTVKEVLALGLTSLVPPEVQQRRMNARTEEKNAKDRAAAWFDSVVMSPMPVECISALTGKHRSTVSRYIKRAAQQGIVPPTRASLQGLSRWR